MAAKGKRIKIRMASTESGYFYTTYKSVVNTTTKLELKKYDPVVKRHVIFKEKKIG